MKIVIDIPDEDYKFIKDLQSLIIGSRGNCKTIQKNVINAIRNGTPYNPSGESISRDALKEHAQKLLVEESINTYFGINLYKMFEEIIDNAPTVEPKLSDKQIEEIADLLEIEWGYEGIREDVSRILRGEENG